MLAYFNKNLKQFKSFSEKDSTLLAISGGIDSVVMCYIFAQAKLSFGIAHCNFKLRGSDSDADEQFVIALASSLKVPFFITSFDTKAIVEKEKKSIQVAARDLRYQWLETIRKDKGYKWIATAHHLNDSIETFIYNFTKGCGLRGLHGIPSQNGAIIRPMLFATRQDIEDFAQENNIRFREDQSNFSDKYARNKIRHQVVPTLKNINPQFEHSAGDSMQRVQEAEQLLEYTLNQIRNAVLTEKGAYFQLDWEKLNTYPAIPTVLFELLRPYGTNNTQIRDIIQAMNRQAGKMFYTNEFEILCERKKLIIRSKKENTQPSKYLMNLKDKIISLPEGRFHIEEISAPSVFSNNPMVTVFDKKALHFPLILRRWKAGDVFSPLGMQGKRQKVQDFLSNLKLSRFEKEKVWILESEEQICWIVGLRIDERFKVLDNTKECLKITFEKN